jgi:predicted transcriptional regulator of viral defense system
MKRDTLIDIVGDEPMFTTGMLVGPGVDPRDVRKQLARWTKSGVVLQVRRGLYALGSQYRRADPHPFEVSNALVPGSYVSLETALAEAGLIPEAVFVTTAVTTGRAGSRKTPFGEFVYQHVKESLFWGYVATDLGSGRTAFVATPEKALLDLAYLRSHSEKSGFAKELRLQRLDSIDAQRLLAFATRFGSRKVERFARNVIALAREESEEYQTS